MSSSNTQRSGSGEARTRKHESASDQVLLCLLTECYIKILIKMKMPPNNLSKGNGLVQLIRGENSIRYKWVNNHINYCSSGSVILSRLLFLLCINDIDIVSNIRRFAWSVKLALILLQQKTVKLAAFFLQQKTVKLAARVKNGKVGSNFSAAKNGQVSSNFAAAKNGKVGSNFMAEKKRSS